MKFVTPTGLLPVEAFMDNAGLLFKVPLPANYGDYGVVDPMWVAPRSSRLVLDRRKLLCSTSPITVTRTHPTYMHFIAMDRLGSISTVFKIKMLATKGCHIVRRNKFSWLRTKNRIHSELLYLSGNSQTRSAGNRFRTWKRSLRCGI